MKTEKINNLSSFTWSIAEILRGDFKQSEYGKVILPFVVLRRLDCILERTKQAVLTAQLSLPQGIDDDTRDLISYSARRARTSASTTRASSPSRACAGRMPPNSTRT
jgi:type I restriction enzyme M protein